MEDEHISIEEMEEVAYFSGKLDSEEGKRFQEKAGRLNYHIARCKDCLIKYREIMNKADREKGIFQDEVYQTQDDSKNIMDSNLDKTLEQMKEDSDGTTIRKEVQKELYSNNDELGMVLRVWDESPYYSDVTTELGVMPEKLYNIAKNYNVGLLETIEVFTEPHDSCDDARISFKSYDKCTKKQKKLIDKRKKDMEKFRKKVEQDKSPVYDKKGIISLPIFKQNRVVMNWSWKGEELKYIISGEVSEQSYAQIEDYIEIPMTQRELAKIGLLPEEVNWREQTQEKSISRDMKKEIAEADKEIVLTKIEMGGIRGLINKIREKFKDKGEKND